MRDFRKHINERPQGIIHCDMDGVLVDIIGGMCKLKGVPCFATNSEFEKWLDKHKAIFDKEHPRLFAHLPWKSDGKRLWAYVSRHGAHILSAHTRSWQPTSKEDKMTWINANMSPKPTKIHIVLRSNKKDYAKTNGIPNILIDDFELNIREWEAAGGVGILHTSSNDTIKKLKAMGY